MELPLVFRQRMQKLLSEEYETFLSCYEKPPYQGVRLNSLKCGEETLRGMPAFFHFAFPIFSALFLRSG